MQTPHRSAIVELGDQIEQHRLETDAREQQLYEFVADIERVRASIIYGRTAPARSAVQHDIESLVRAWAFNAPQSELRLAAIRRLATIALNDAYALCRAEEELRRLTPDPNLPTSSLFDEVVGATWNEKILGLPELLGLPIGCLHARLRRNRVLRSFAGHSRELRIVLHFARVVRYASTWLSLDSTTGDPSEPDLTPLSSIVDRHLELDEQQIERILELASGRYGVADALGRGSEPETTPLTALLDRAITRDQQRADGTFACESLRHGSIQKQ